MKDNIFWPLIFMIDVFKWTKLHSRCQINVQVINIKHLFVLAVTKFVERVKIIVVA